jgi:hypothetical protein
VDEAFMAGHVDEVEANVVLLEARESEVDRDAAFLFLWKPITIGAGERLDESRLAVVDMTRGSVYNVSHRTMVHRRRNYYWPGDLELS